MENLRNDNKNIYLNSIEELIKCSKFFLEFFSKLEYNCLIFFLYQIIKNKVIVIVYIRE